MFHRCVSLSFLTVLLLTTPATAAAQPSRSQLQRLLQRFPDADANSDGTLSPQEARNYQKKRRASQKRRDKKKRPTPTHTNVQYGDHERHVFDLWLPAADEDAAASKRPVYVFFHGGGFVGGDKRSFDPTPFLEANLGVVSANYRFVDGTTTLSPAPLRDGARVIQYLRTRADEWSLDESRIAVSGSSAGAVMTLWIGYHDDLADPDSQDPVSRQSSRVRCIIPLDGPTELDPRWITANMGGPKQVHQSFPLMFGAGVDGIDRPEVLARVQESSAMPHVSSDDPPTLLIYGGELTGIPLPESATTGVLIHHPYFGQQLKSRLDEHGVPAEFHHSLHGPQKRHPLIQEWLTKHLLNDHAE